MSAVFSDSYEIERLSSLRELGILDTAPDPHFDAIVQVARQVLDVATAAITFIDEDRQWVKAALGMFAAGDVHSRAVAFCNRAISAPQDPLIIEDASQDPEFADNPLVVQPGGIRFYAGVPLLDDAGLALGTLCVIDPVPRQISDRELAILKGLATAVATAIEVHRNLQDAIASGQRRKETIDLNPKVPWVSNPDGHILEVSPSLVITLATGTESIIGPNWANLIHPDDLRDAQERRERAVERGEPYDIEHRMRSADGSWRWFRSFAAPRRNDDGDIVVWFGSSEDITERRLVQQRVTHMAYHDGLTGLPNRIKFSELFEARIAKAGKANASFALLCLDLNHFKGINDRLGHPAGDTILKLIGERLLDCVGPTGALSRFGGDEFFILQDGPSADAASSARQLAAILRVPIVVDGYEFSATASIGVAQYPQDGTDPDTLFRKADLALFRAKATGRDNFQLFETDLDEQQSRVLALRLDLKAAIEQEEFELAYQPLIDLPSGTIVSFEALLRWRHKSMGWVSPAEFIPCAEESGQIIPIGKWVIEHACRQAATWPGDVSVAVNLSPLQFQDPQLKRVITGALERSGLAAHRLELEITESAIMLDDDANVSLLRDLRDSGIKIALDDFGTGYSSLSYLQRFPFDKLKLDRSLVVRMADGEGGRAVVRAIVAMCTALGISVTAEGIETSEQLEFVRIEHCHQFQGYLASRPVPFAQVAPLIHRFNDGPEKVVFA